MPVDTSGLGPVYQKIEEWKNSLIDFSRRNTLLFSRTTKRSTLPIISPDPETIFRKLVVSRSKWSFYLPPDIEKPDDPKNRRKMGGQKTHDVQMMINVSSDTPPVNIMPVQKVAAPKANELSCGIELSGSEIESILKNLQRRSLSEYRERGVNILYATFGKLIWKDVDYSSEEITSPVLLVPIQISRETVTSPFYLYLAISEDEFVLNPALDLKLKKEFAIELPDPDSFDASGVDDSEDAAGFNLRRYFQSIRVIIDKLGKGWKLEESVEIGVHSFQKIVIYNDLEANAEQIAQSPVIQAMAGNKDIKLLMDSLPEEDELDSVEAPEKTFHILDADGSQRICIDYAIAGQSLIIQGPPGTGKSQTIANIIAAAIANSKTVLFLSDKMAALDVVYTDRLKAAKLDDFCLVLHSNKANKNSVVTELKRCRDLMIVPKNLPSPLEYQRLQNLRQQLNEYVQSLHKSYGPMGLSAYRLLARSTSLRNYSYIKSGFQVDIESFTPLMFQELESLIMRLSSVWRVVEAGNTFLWRSYNGSDYNAERNSLADTLDELTSAISELDRTSRDLSQKIGLVKPINLEEVKRLIHVGQLLKSNPLPERSWFYVSNLADLIAEATVRQTIANSYHLARDSLLSKYDEGIFSVPNDSLNQFAKSIRQLGLSLSFDLLSDGNASTLRKRESELAIFLDRTKDTSNWKLLTSDIVANLGLSSNIQEQAQNNDLTIDSTLKITKLCLLSFSEEKPESSWLDSKSIANVKAVIARAKPEYDEYRSLKRELALHYGDEIYDLQLDELMSRYNNSYANVSKWLRRDYYKDRRNLMRISLSGRLSDNLVSDLAKARRAKSLKQSIDSTSAMFRELAGHFYQGYATDFSKIALGITLAENVIEYEKEIPLTPRLVELVSIDSKKTVPEETSHLSPHEIKKEAQDLEEKIVSWLKDATNLYPLIPLDSLPNSSKSIRQTKVSLIQSWSNEAAQSLQSAIKTANTVLASLRNPVADPSTVPYSQILQDLTVVDTLRKTESQVSSEQESLKERFGNRFALLDTNWDEIIISIECLKKLLEELGNNKQVSDALVRVACNGRDNAPSIDAVLKYDQLVAQRIANVESWFATTPTFDGSQLSKLDLAKMENTTKAMRQTMSDAQFWIDFRNISKSLEQYGFKQFLDTLVLKAPPSSQLIDMFRKSVYEDMIGSIWKKDPILNDFRRENHEQTISMFREVDRKLIDLAAGRVIEEANKRKPQGTIHQASNSELAVLDDQAARKRKMHIRRLFQKMPNLLLRLKPCLLMSPLSVSQFLDPRYLKFDIVIFDEASQVLPEDAIGAIYRGSTIIVAGDDKQLPPTSFFQKTQIDQGDWDEEEESITATDVQREQPQKVVEDDSTLYESILDKLNGIQLPKKTLNWHYRSKTDQLIAFSNDRFYGNQLNVFPAVYSNRSDLGVKFVLVENGRYARGENRDNIIEAERVADLVLEQVRLNPKKSLGVVAFSIAQMRAIKDITDDRLKSNPELEPILNTDRTDNRLQGFFIKNLESVQGDERDVIILSIGYGKDQSGRLRLNFGPINRPGGERRLNVAITRAREKLVVVSSFQPEELDISKTKSEGILSLHKFLLFAKNGPSVLQTKSTGGGYESELEEDVANEIKSKGYNVEPQVGCGGYRIDLAVIDPAKPGRYILGVECDGATYHSSKNARDRDRLRQQVLEKLGWRIYRIWAPSWVVHRETEVRKLKDAIDAARDFAQQMDEKEMLDRMASKTSQVQVLVNYENGLSTSYSSQLQSDEKSSTVEGSGTETSSPSLPNKTFETIPIKLGQMKVQIPYKVCKLEVRRPSYSHKSNREEFYEAYRRREELLLLEKLVAEEGPIHFDLATQRLASAYGLERIGPRIESIVTILISECERNGKLVRKGEFLWPPQIASDSNPEQRSRLKVRVPVRGNKWSYRRINHIPSEEFETAIITLVYDNVGIPMEALVAEVASIFGYARTGQIIKQTLQSVADKMIKEGTLIVKGNIVSIGLEATGQQDPT